jgi:hypothetical protein
MRLRDAASFAGKGTAGSLAAAAILAPAGAGAATLTVNTLDETPDQPGECTLDYAIINANSNSNFFSQCPATGPYGDDTINITATGVMNRTDMVAPINSNVDINGPGSELLDIHRQPTNPTDHFRIFYNGPSTITSLSGVTLSNGRISALDTHGGGLMNQGGTLTLDDVAVRGNTVEPTSATADVYGAGGGIYNTGTLTVRHSTVANNTVSASQTATSGERHAFATGGGIWSEGTLTVERSTIADNTVTAIVASNDVDSDAFGEGGGILVSGAGSALRTSTVSGNDSVASAPSPAAATEAGGGVSNHVELAIVGSTLAFNTGALAANLYAGWDESVTSTILYNEGEYNCFGTVETDGGFNLEYPESCDGLGGAIHQDPELGPLAGNGGPTLTHALGPFSPALDQGNAGTSTSDQRDLTRPVDLAVANAAGGDGTDIGAFEAQDNDGDGISNEADSCPASGGGGNASGCPSANRTLTLKYSVRRERFKGTLAAPGFAACQTNRPVTLFKVRDGDDKPIGQPSTDANGKYILEKRGRPGKRYYAAVEQEVIGAVAECEAAVSPTVKVPK